MIGSSAIASTSAALPFDAGADESVGAAMPVASKIKSMMSDFFVRGAGFSDIAAAMA
jgi:hypothetical protein